MRIAIISTLLLLVGVSSTSTSECKTLCADSRQQLLGDNATCKPALKHSSGGNQKSFTLCVEGRKKAFTQACIPLCKKSELVLTSYDGCKSIAKKHSNQAFSWCRKGYESVLSSLSPLLDTLKKIDKEQKSVETTASKTTKESIVVSEPPVTIEETVVPVSIKSVVKTDDVNIETSEVEEPKPVVEKKIEEEPVKKTIEPIVRKPINTYRHQEQVVHKPVDKASLTIEAKDEPKEEPLVDEVKEKLDKKEDKTTEEESTTDTETIASHDDSTSFKDDNEEEKKAETEETEL